MASIPKSNISNGNTIQPADIKNIIDALDGTTSYDITMKGTLNITGSVITGSISNAVSSSYSLSSSRAVSSSYSISSSYVASSSYAITASFVASSSYSVSSSYVLSSSYAPTSSNCTVDDGTIWMLSKDSSFVGGPVVVISGSRNGKIQPSLLIYGKLQQRISGTNNTLIGDGAGENMNPSLAEQNNTAVGFYALLTITDGAHINNTAIGSNTLYHNVTSSNTALGSFAGKRTTTGHDNTYIGTNAGSGSLTGRFNVAVGSDAIKNNTTSSNVAIGYQAGTNNTTGHENVYIGSYAGSGSLTGRYNVAIGSEALEFNTSSSNTAIGYQAGISNTIGRDNTYVGFQAGASGSGNHSNVAVGFLALSASISSSNTAIGWRAGATNTTGWNNTFIGNGAAGVAVGSSHSITLGNSSIATLRCQQTAITALSDRRDKTDISPLQLGVDFINELNPVTFTWNMRDGGKVGIPDLGFIAQDLQELENRYDVKEHTQLVYEENPNKLEATWGRLLPIAIKAIQELSQKNKELKEILNKPSL